MNVYVVVVLMCAGVVASYEIIGTLCNDTYVYAPLNLTEFENIDAAMNMYEAYNGCASGKSGGTVVVGMIPPHIPWQFTDVTICFISTGIINVTMSVIVYPEDPTTVAIADSTNGIPTTIPIAISEVLEYEIPKVVWPTSYCMNVNLSMNETFLIRRNMTMGNTTIWMEDNTTVWIGFQFSACHTSLVIAPKLVDLHEIHGPNRRNGYPDYTSDGWRIPLRDYNDTFAIMWAGHSVCEEELYLHSSSLSPSSSLLPSSLSSSYVQSSEISNLVSSILSLSDSQESSSDVNTSETNNTYSSSTHSTPTSSQPIFQSSSHIVGGASTTIIIICAVCGGVAICGIGVGALVILFVYRRRRRNARYAEYNNSIEFSVTVDESYTRGIDGAAVGMITPTNTTDVHIPQNEAEAFNFASNEFLKSGATDLQMCPMTDLITVAPKHLSFGQLTVDNANPVSVDLTLSYAADPPDCVIDIFIVGYGYKVFKITFPERNVSGGGLVERPYITAELLPEGACTITVHATAMCSTTTRKPNLLIVAKTRTLPDSYPQRISGRRREKSRHSLARLTTSKPSTDIQGTPSRKSTQSLQVRAKVDPSPRLDPDEINIITLVGEGSFGKVYRATWRGMTVAVKTFKMAGYSEQMAREITKEVSMQGNMKNPYIATLYGVVIDAHIGMVIEFFELGGLDTLIARAETTPAISEIMTAALRVRYALDVAMGMQYLVMSGILHRDLKPGNVLVASTNDISDSPCCKLTDFGTARTAIDGDDATATCTRGIGTPVYMAPEVLMYDKTKPCYTEASDVYSFAILCYQLFSGYDPFPVSEFASTWRISEAVTKGRRPVTDVLEHRHGSELGAQLTAFVEQCWQQKPEDRPPFSDIVEKLKNVHSQIYAQPQQ